MSARQEHVYGFTLDVSKERQNDFTDEDLQQKMINMIRTLDNTAAEDGWSYCIEWVLSDVSYTKIKPFESFGIALDETKIERTPWHVHGNLYATAGATAWKIIKEYWQKNVNGAANGTDGKRLDKENIPWRGWFEYVEGNRKYSSRTKIYRRASKDLKGRNVIDIGVEQGLLV